MAEESVQSEEEVKRQRLAKLAAWRQQQAVAPVKVEQPSSPKPFSVFDDDPEEDDEKALKQEAQTAAWYVSGFPLMQRTEELQSCICISLLYLQYNPSCSDCAMFLQTACSVHQSSLQVSLSVLKFDVAQCLVLLVYGPLWPRCCTLKWCTSDLKWQLSTWNILNRICL